MEFVAGPIRSYCGIMAEAKKPAFEEATPIPEEEDESTLEAIDRGLKAADEGRVVPLDEVRKRIEKWLPGSSSPKTR